LTFQPTGTCTFALLVKGLEVGLEIRLQYFEACPHWRLAEQRLRAALADAGRAETKVRRQRVETPTEAAAVGFGGSPTVLVDGRDPFAAGSAPEGLTCRRYRTERGMEGAPSVAQLRAVIARG
jgi:hypothetical protein